MFYHFVLIKIFFIIETLTVFSSTVTNVDTHLYLFNYSSINDKVYCERPWPQLDLFIPLSFGYTNQFSWRNNEMEKLFLRSFLLFWPLRVSNTSLNILIDKEEIDSPHLANLKKIIDTKVKPKLPGGVRFSVNNPSSYYRRGADRQQLLMFWADNFTNSEYVGFVDGDAVLLTYIDREDLFEEGKPVVNARSGAHCCDVWSLMPGTTYRSIGILEPVRCMSYFPVIIKTSHLKHLREYVSKYHNNMPFNDVFYRNISLTPFFSQFNIMCTFLYHFHKDEYKWYIHSETPKWDGKNPQPLAGQDGNLSIFTKEMYLPKPRVATHARYRGKKDPKILKWTETLNHMLQRGVCMSPPFPTNNYYKVCDNSQQTYREGYFDEMHKFEYFDMTLGQYNTRESLQNEYNKRYERIKNCSHDWDKNEILRIMKPLNEMQESN